MPLSLSDLTGHLATVLPKGFSPTDAPFTLWAAEAARMAVRLAAPEFRERVFFDCIGDGVTTRYLLPGYNIAPLPESQWTFPATVNVSGGVATPATAPTVALVAGASGIPSGAVLAAAYEWVTASGRTGMSPTTSVTTTSLGQTLTVTVPAFPLGVVSANLYTTIAVINPLHLGQAATGVVSLATTGLVLGSATTLPLVDYVDPANVTFTLSSGAIGLEYSVSADETALATALNGSTITLATPLTSGQRFRAWYTRDPLVPTSLTAPILGPPDDFLIVMSEALMYRTLARQHEGSAKDEYAKMYESMSQLALQMKSNTSSRPTTTARTMQWSQPA